MAFMRPVAEYGQWIVCETSQGTQLVPGDVVHLALLDRLKWTLAEGQMALLNWEEEELDKFVEGKIYTAALAAGWCSRLSAPEYMDCTEWQGPYKNRNEALAAVMEEYQVDENGDDINDDSLAVVTE